MKRIFTIVAALIMTASVWAQAPEKMSYQAVVRDASNALVTSQSVGMQISILQGGATGTAVYVETQTPTTNINGLLSLEIGTGAIVSGDFTTIDWENDTYFIKTETDPTGGASYTVTGTSQLMSVPYALHAKTADNIVGGITETDPTFTASEAANITATDITNLSNLSGTNTGDQTVITAAQATAITANTAKVGVTPAQATILGNTSGTNTGDQTVITTAQANAITVNTAKVGVTTAQATILGNTSGTNTGDQTISRAGTTVTLTNGGTFTDSVNTYTSGIGIDITNNEISTTEPTYTIGLNAALGGYVFYVTLDGKHGLVAETQDQTTSTNWYTAQDIISDPANHSTNGQNFTDWRLPTKYELNQMYLQRVAIGGFASNFYWSSTELDNDNARSQLFSIGLQFNLNKNDPFYVRAVRAF